MRGIDFSSWQGVLSTLAGLVLITLLGVGIRLLVMQTLDELRAGGRVPTTEELDELAARYDQLNLRD